MVLPLIPFSVPGNRHLSLGDAIAYRDPYVIISHQFGFFRINATTGAYLQRTGVGYNNPAFPPSDINTYLIGDQNQSVTELTANASWIVTDNIAAIAGPDPAALVWNNNAGLTYHGAVNKVNGYWWNRGTHPVIDGNFLYVRNDRGSYDKMNVSTLAWVAKNVSAPANTDELNVGGSTYTWSSADGGDTNYNAIGSGAGSFALTGAWTSRKFALAGNLSQSYLLSGALVMQKFQFAGTQSVDTGGAWAAQPFSFHGYATVFPVEQVAGDPVNTGYAYTVDQLEASVRANTEFTTCPLTHETPDISFHKQPLIAECPGERADSGTTRTILHTKNGGQWDTTVVAIP